MCLVPPPRFERGMFTTQGRSFTGCLLHPLAYDGSKHIPIVCGWKGGTRTPNAFCRRQHQKLLTCQLVYLPIITFHLPAPTLWQLIQTRDVCLYPFFWYFHLVFSSRCCFSMCFMLIHVVEATGFEPVRRLRFPPAAFLPPCLPCA